MDVVRSTLPSGGGALRGIGESFQPQLYTGTACFSIPIPSSPCRGLEPQLSLDYSAGAGNGVFGLGFHLGLPSIARKTHLQDQAIWRFRWPWLLSALQ